MIRFKKFITLMEGGNIKVEGGQAAPFDSSLRSTLQPELRAALVDLHNKVRQQHGVEAFGTDAAAIHKGTGFAGSTNHFFDKEIGHNEYKRIIPNTGDIDVQADAKHTEAVKATIASLTNQKIGNFTVLGHKGHGVTTSMVLHHPQLVNPIQIDVEHVDYDGDHPHEGERFVNSSSFEDRKLGIKGVHHKLLLHAAAQEKEMKFSAGGGLKGKDEPAEARGPKESKIISTALFGEYHPDIHSFGGVARLINKHYTPEQKQSIATKFTQTADKRARSPEHTANAIRVLHDTFGLPQPIIKPITEQVEQEHHVHVAFMGASPHTHMGHINDVIGSMGKGAKFVGLSGKSDLFTDEERADIANRQSQGKAEFKVEKTAGQTVGRAVKSLNAKPDAKIHLHLHFGSDRAEMAERLKSSIMAGRIPELEGQIPNRVTIHYPEDPDRSHGLSGTNMRRAASEKDFATYKKHLGPSFSDAQARGLMNTIHDAIATGKLPVKRK